MNRQRIGIVGAGISGLGCAHFLYRHHDITVFEKDGRVGGHSHTVMVPEEDREVPVDTGFMVYNEVTYPLLTRLFAQLGVATKPTSMSFSVQHTQDKLEFNGGSLNLLFGQRRNLLRPRFWRMLAQIKRFNRETVQELKEPRHPDLTLQEYVAARRYGSDFLNWYLSPMAAAVWSCPPDKIKDFPAHALMRFWYNHGFLGLDTQHPWRTVEGGSRKYVEKLTEPFALKIHRNADVKEVTGDLKVVLGDGSEHFFDQVIIASHGDEALRMLASPTSAERDLLGAFSFQPNDAVLHTDQEFMPRTKRCWASWNYRVEGEKHSTHYWMNSLQGVSERANYFVSINPTAVREARVVRKLKYEHPVFNLPSMNAQERMMTLHEAGKTTGRYFCGAWQRYGFHEDGLWSADRLCGFLLGKDPWS